MDSPVVIFVTTSSMEEANAIGKKMVEEKLVACANIIPKIRSLYLWKGKFCDESEVLLMMKSRQGLLDRIVRGVEELHSYEVPEVVALPVLGGSEDYLRWVEESLS